MINLAKQAHEYQIKTLEEMISFQQLNYNNVSLNFAKVQLSKVFIVSQVIFY